MAYQGYSHAGGNLLPEGWTEDNLGNLVSVERGSSPRPIKNFVTDKDGVNWVKIGDTKEGQKYVDNTKEMITKEGALKSRFVGVGDFILSNSMSFGRPYIMAIEGYIHDGWFALRLPKEINSDYFYYLLSSSFVQDQFQLLAVGGVVKNISGDLVKKAMLPLPPLAEQKIIADKLDTLLAQVETTKARLERIPNILKSFRQSVLAAAVSGKLTEDWREKNELDAGSNIKIEDVATVVRGGSPRPASDPKYFGGDTAWITVKEITKDSSKFLTNTERNVSELGKSKSRLIEEGTLLLTNSGATLGVPKITNIPGCINDGVVAITNVSEPVKSYLYYVLLSMTTELRTVNQGAAQPNLNTGIVKAIEFLHPQKIEMEYVVKKVEELFAFADTIEQKANAALDRVNNLTQSILAKAFRGELTADWRAANPDLISGENSAEALLEKIKAEREAMKKQPK